MRWLAALLILLPGPAIAQKLDGKLECRYAGMDFVYDCTITLLRGGQPLSGAQVTVGADMPSMPMAHNIKPVNAKPTSKPGEYQARLDLEMTGEWAVKLRIAGPVRDQLVLHYIFTESGTAPRK
ncbi:MAG TPA: FixH family protein [Burkholderiales bacterium]|jgi:YtkA-like|nr:FixH family protein [Burkholderiales bacterium]